jgi:transcriptional regulator with XRE-family HTH domain
MNERPDPPAWGALITAALASEGISAREAARRAGMSEGRWRQITAGYQVVSPGVYAQVHGPAGTLARMAAVVGVTPDQLKAAGRDDAATVLAGQLERRPADDEMLERIKAMDTDQARELLATIAVRLGISLPAAGADENDRRYGT